MKCLYIACSNTRQIILDATEVKLYLTRSERLKKDGNSQQLALTRLIQRSWQLGLSC